MQAEDDIGGSDGTRDGDPFQGSVKLEGEKVNVEEHDLGDEDVIADRKGSSKNAFRSGHGVGESGKRCHCELISNCTWHLF